MTNSAAAGQVISNTGSWMQRVAQDWLVLERTHGSGTALGITTGLQFLPMLASPWGGVVADRYPKRVILMVTQALMGPLAAILGILARTGAVRTWHVYLKGLPARHPGDQRRYPLRYGRDPSGSGPGKVPDRVTVQGAARLTAEAVAAALDEAGDYRLAQAGTFPAASGPFAATT